MSLDLDKSTWKRIAFGDVTKASKESCDPTDGSVGRYVAGEHMDTDDLKIRSWGDIGDGYLGPAFHRRFRAGQVLYGSRRTYLRKVAVAEFDGVCANTTFVVETKDESVLLQEFLPFIMTSEPFHAFAIGESKGSVNPYVNWSDVARYELNVPPLNEQRRIADLLWAIERHRRVIRDLLPNVRTAFETWFADRLEGLPTRPLAEVVRLQHGRPVPSGLYGDDGVPLLRPGDMKPGGDTRWTASTVRIPARIADDNRDWLLEPGDLVINMTAQSLEDRFLGRVCRLHDRALLNQRIGRLDPILAVRRAFLHLALRTREFTDWVAQRSEGSKVKHMHWRHIERYPVPLPELGVQKQIEEEAAAWLHAFECISAEIRATGALANAVSADVFGRAK